METTTTEFRVSGGSPPEDEQRGGNSASSANEVSARAAQVETPADEAADGQAVSPAPAPPEVQHSTSDTSARAVSANSAPEAVPATPDAVPTALLTPGEVTELQAHELSIQGRDFIHGWVSYGTSRTDAPPKFHELVAYTLVSVAIDRNRWLALRHKNVHASVYGLGIAPSGGRKSTPLNYGETAVLSAFKDRMLSNEYSPEALITDLANRTPSRGVMFVDEAGRLLTTMRRQGYGEALKDVLSRVWDAPPTYRRQLNRQGGTFTLTDVYVSLVMMTTESRFAETTSPEDITSGFLARFLPMVATEEIKRRDIDRRTEDVDETERTLVAALKDMKAHLAQSPGPMTITDEALKRLNQTERDLEMWASRQYHVDLIAPWARRLAEYGGRLAIIFAVSENEDEVDRPQVLRAIRVVDQAKEDMLMLVDEMTKGPAARQLDRIERFIRANPGITTREVQRRANIRAKDLTEVLRDLVSQGRIHPKGERPLKLYPSVRSVRSVSLSVVSSVSQEVSVKDSGEGGFKWEPRASTDTTDTPTHDTSARARPMPTGESLRHLLEGS